MAARWLPNVGGGGGGGGGGGWIGVYKSANPPKFAAKSAIRQFVLAKFESAKSSTMKWVEVTIQDPNEIATGS
jgi:hypothetical protein